MRSGSALATFGVAALLAAGSPALAQSGKAPALRSAAGFAVLAHQWVTSCGASRITGNVGVSPGDEATGFPSGTFSAGDLHRDDALARQARIDSDAAGDQLFAQPPDFLIETPSLGGKMLPGVYRFTAPDVQLNGTLLLDAAGDRDAVWVFVFAGTLTTASDASVLVTRGGYDGNVFWWTGGSATLGARTTFAGNLFARTNVTAGDGASISGRIFARTGRVSLLASKVSLCCAPLLLAPQTLSAGARGAPYTTTITASGGTAPYTFAISSGSLPRGLALAPGGALQGTPAGTRNPAFTVTATDARGCSSTASYRIAIACVVCTGTDVPSLSAWALIAFSVLLAGTGWLVAGKR